MFFSPLCQIKSTCSLTKISIIMIISHWTTHKLNLKTSFSTNTLGFTYQLSMSLWTILAGIYGLFYHSCELFLATLGPLEQLQQNMWRRGEIYSFARLSSDFFFSKSWYPIKVFLSFFCGLGPIKICNKVTAQTFTQNRNVRNRAETQVWQTSKWKVLIWWKIWMRWKRFSVIQFALI